MSRVKYGNGEYHRIGYNNSTFRKVAYGAGPIYTLISYTATRVSDMGSGSFTHNTSSAGYTNANSTVKVSNSLKSSYYPYSMSSTSSTHADTWTGKITGITSNQSKTTTNTITSHESRNNHSYPAPGVTLMLNVSSLTRRTGGYYSSYSYTGTTGALNNNSGYTANVSSYTRKCGAQVATYNISRSSSRSSQYTY